MVRRLLHLLFDLALLIAFIALAQRTRNQGAAAYVFAFLAGNSLVDLGNSWRLLLGGGAGPSPTSLPKWLQRLIIGN